MKKSVKGQIIKWYEDGLSVDEFAKLVPQYCRQEIESVIKAYEKEKAWARIVASSRR